MLYSPLFECDVPTIR
ncbi:Hypothetical small peptide [Latilactobacillus sakei subsp. sakei 23K]|uniref:Hypothetical small peptide n=1 Tax=Latilactobacillus sakei subsp. sakei (strain 23K) TaxID=314315 RepID=Q38X47_LATSS|nr:Hypothetical small peptide [Latilactobacillus sakei subsp. sakei 23K]